MPNIAVFLNKKELIDFDKVCNLQKCNRYNLAKKAVRKYVEENLYDRETREETERRNQGNAFKSPESVRKPVEESVRNRREEPDELDT